MAQIPLTELAHVIEMAVAPVFLLTGVGALLGVLTNRLSRIVDRARGIETALLSAPPGQALRLRTELRQQAKRARVSQAAISLCTACALLISSVVVVMFIGVFAELELTALIAGLFVLGLLLLILGLLCFLREVYLATRYMRFDELSED